MRQGILSMLRERGIEVLEETYMEKPDRDHWVVQTKDLSVVLGVGQEFVIWTKETAPSVVDWMKTKEAEKA